MTLFGHWYDIRRTNILLDVDWGAWGPTTLVGRNIRVRFDPEQGHLGVDLSSNLRSRTRGNLCDDAQELERESDSLLTLQIDDDYAIEQLRSLIGRVSAPPRWTLHLNLSEVIQYPNGRLTFDSERKLLIFENRHAG